MITHTLLLRLWHFSQALRHPLIRYEMRRTPLWQPYAPSIRWWTRRLLWGLLALGLIAFVSELVGGTRASFLVVMFTFFLPFLALIFLALIGITITLWQIPIALAGAGVIVQERAARTWDLLLTTPIPRTDLLLAKFWVGLSRQTSFLSLITFMQIFPLLAILGQVSSQLGNVHGIAPLILYGFTALVFVVARLQEFLLAGMIGLYASLVAESWGLASIGSVAIALVVYLIRIFITYILVIGIAGGKVIDLSGVLFAGLPFLITGGKNLWAGYALCIIAVIVQEAVIRVVHTLLIREMRVRR